MSVYVAYLRVYEPIGSFPPEIAQHWQDVAGAGAAPDRAAAAAAEHLVALHNLVGSAPDPDVVDPEVLVIVDDGVTYACPLDLPLRRFEALADFRDELPPALAAAFVPAALSDRVAVDHDRWLAGRPGASVAHVLAARWQVPLRWFVAFEPAERRLVLGRRAERYAAVGADTEVAAAGVARTLGYVTAMSRARRRVARALGVLRRTVVDGPIVDGIEDLGRWLEEFHPHSLVELDYGGLVHLLDDDALQADSSAVDVAEALSALRRGDGARTAAAYERVVMRWRGLAAIEAAN